jgi:hypothetical protein
MKVRQQIKAYVAGQLAACTQPDPDRPDQTFQARLIRLLWVWGSRK